MDTVVQWVWGLTLVGMVWLYVVCQVAPQWMVRWQSMPWTFQLKRNLDLEFQAVTYEAYHRNWWSRGTHYLLIPEQVAWFAVLWAVHPICVVAMLTVVAYQSYKLGENRFALGMVPVWLLLASLGVGLTLAGASAVVGSQAFLMVAAIVRVIGHASEPMPPMLVEESDQFVPLSIAHIHPRLAVVGLFGYLSEFGSALPFRLFPVQAYLLALSWGYRPSRAPDREELLDAAEQVHRHGWRAHPSTEPLFS